MEISFEFFPPKTPEGESKLEGVRRQLEAVNPHFFSVTYGAGGSTQSGTLKTVQSILADGFDAAPHLSCIGADANSIRELLRVFRDTGVKRIVALRGDLPSGMGFSGEFRYASDLVAFIRQETGAEFTLEVAAYPEMHPQAKSPQQDMDAFIAKVKAGADSAITQYFYNTDAYLRFRDQVAARGVSVPLLPGIMPITNFSQLARFSDACGAEIPRWIRSQLQSFGDDLDAIRAFGHDVVLQLCARLKNEGVPGFHFYTMNNAGPTLRLLQDLRLS
jgi:methylenetetrahydrofolate reductase (NADPH)